jgi:oxygen-dependent protoporphyrinogen oxidase
LQTLNDRMAAALPASCARLGDSVTEVARCDEKWRVSALSKAVEFDAVVVATPADVTRRLLAPLDAAFNELLVMDASSAIVVALAFAPEAPRSLRIPRGFGFLAPRTSRREAEPQLLACTFVDQKFEHRVPEGGVLLRAFFSGDDAPRRLGSSDGEIVALAWRQLSTLLEAIAGSHRLWLCDAGRVRWRSMRSGIWNE